MSRRLLVFGLLAAGLLGCTTRHSPLPPPYLTNLSKPSYVLSNFILAYQARDIVRYRALLSDDFKYQFQEGSAEAERFPGGWDVAQDSTATLAFMSDTSLGQITLAMVFTPADSSMFEGDTTFVASSADILFSVGFADSTFRIDKYPAQEFHLIQGRADMGENPEWFYIRAWTELPFPEPEGETDSAPAAQDGGPTWGALKAFYAPADEGS